MAAVVQPAEATTEQSSHPVEKTTCCIVGCGPAGATLALLLARQGVGVTLLEAHHSLDRDFRGDTMVPAVLEIMDQLGLAGRLLDLPHGEFGTLAIRSGDQTMPFVDMRRLRTRFPFITMLPQARFLEVVLDEARLQSSFRLVMGARVEALVEHNSVVRGVRYRAADGWHELRADLVIGADGRFSRLRELSGLRAVGTAEPVDLLWLRLPREAGEPLDRAGLYVGDGHLVTVLNRGPEWQIAYWIAKGSMPQIRASGFDPLRRSLGRLVPWLADRVQAVDDWKQTSLLAIESNRLLRWHRPGLLLIGDAAHVVGPVGGVGIRLAIEDAVAAGNRLAEPLLDGVLRPEDLARVQRDRQWATRIVLGYQAFAQRQLLASRNGFSPPMRLLPRIPLLRGVPARVFGISLRPIQVAPAARH